jgi:very-short-patch-repair endonuclease
MNMQTDWSKRANEVFHQNLGNFLRQRMQIDNDADLLILIRDRMSVGLALRETCESPIEEIVAAILPFVSDIISFIHLERDERKDVEWVVYPQAERSGYRLDFLIACKWDKAVRFLAIECDGHDFHDRTKEQAARDKARDRKLLSEGVRVMRFTGYELYRDPQAVGLEIEKVLGDLLCEAGVEAGDIPPAGIYW